MNKMTLLIVSLLSFTANATLGTDIAAITNAPNANFKNDSTIKKTLDEKVPLLLEEYRIPSISIARIDAGKLIFANAYGMQNPSVPATTRTLYNIASMTKPISAEVILRLISASEKTSTKNQIQTISGLDEAMYSYWIDPDISNDTRVRKLTPRLALSHQTGLPNWRYQTQKVLKFNFEPGEKFGYSGEGYEFVSHFAESKWKQTFEDLAKTYVFDPLDMQDTAYGKQAWFAGRIAAPSDAKGNALSPLFAQTYLASDLMYSTPTDYAKFMLSVMSNQGLGAQIAAERNKIQVRHQPNICPTGTDKFCPQDLGFGLGWELYQYQDEQFMMHTGSDEGVFTFGYLNPNKRSGIIIFTNSANGGKIIIPLLESLQIDANFVKYLKASVAK